MAVAVNQDSFSADVLHSAEPVLVDFYLDGCIPCKRMSPVLSELEKEFDGRLKIVKVNTRFNEELVDAYDVLSAPTMVFFKNGEEQERVHGVTNKSLLIDIISKLI